MKKSLLISAGLVFAATPLFAQGEGGGHGARSQTSLEELQVACQELLQNQQIKPFKVQITCREVSYEWAEAKPAPKQLPNQREVGGGVRMKNFEVPYQGGPAPIADTQTQCTVLERVKHTIPAVDVELSCEELQNVQNLTSFCTPIIDDRVEADPSIVTTEKTGEIYNTCSGLSR